MLKRFTLFILLIGATACTGIVTKRGAEDVLSANLTEPKMSPQLSEAVPSEVDASIPVVQIESLPPIPVKPLDVVLESQEKSLEFSNGTASDAAAENQAEDSQPQIPVELNARVEKWIQYFTVTDRERFQRFLNRGKHYRDVVENVLEENDLPPQLYFLAMIESGYRTQARSIAKAVGVWQFIAGTATRYGLRVDRFVDERQDPIRSTEAAAKYLRDLYNVFGSWHLAMAAYNAGEIRILRAVFKGRTRDFWELVEANVLPKETAEYVPKFLAVVEIGKHPEKYGFRNDDPAETYPELEAVSIQASVSLKTISDQLSISLEILERVNPQLIGGRLPREGYEIWVPQKLISKFNKPVDWRRFEDRKIANKRRARILASSAELAKSHLVRQGETLAKIASKYKMSIGHLMRINGLESSRILVGTRLRTQAKTYSGGKMIRYKVRRGDNLSEIARRFGTSIGQIKRANNLFGNKVFAGQALQIRAAEKADGI